MLRPASRNWWSHLITRAVNWTRAGDVDLFLQVFRTYFHQFWRTYVLIFVLIGIVSAATGAAAWLVRDIVNGVFAERNTGMIIPLVVAIVVVFTIRGLSTYFQIVLSQRISNSIVADIQVRLMRHILSQRLEFFTNNTSDSLLMRFNQGAQGFNSILNIVLVNGLRDAATLIGLLVVMLIQDAILTLVSLIVAPLVFLGVAVLRRNMREVSEAEVAGFAELNRQVRETVQGITTIKAYNLEPSQNRMSHGVIDSIRLRRNKIASLLAAPKPLMDATAGIAVALAIFYAGGRMAAGGYDAGTFMSFLTALLLAADPARRLSQLRVQLHQAFVIVGQVLDLLNTDMREPAGTKMPALPVSTPSPIPSASMPPDTPGPTPAIAFHQVEFGYDPQKPVLRGANLTAEQGEMVALVGPSGAGKTTLFKLLLKFHAPHAGRIELFGTDINELDNTALRGAISFVGQTNFMFAGSLLSNLTLHRDDIDFDRVEAACRTVGLHDDIVALPNGYDTDVGELGNLVSGGQAQRLNMARAIIKDAPILLLDEVTSALDAENEQLIKDYMQLQARTKCVLVIAHRLSTVREADCIALLQDGGIAARGKHDDLVAANHYYEKIVSMQLVA